MNLNQSVLKDYLANPLSKSFSKMGLRPSYFIQGYDEIFMNEEYMNDDYAFVKCYSCESDKVKEESFKVKDIKDFFFDGTSLSKIYQERAIENIKEIVKISSRPDLVLLNYCEDCGRILNVNGIPFVFNIMDLEELESRRLDFLCREEKVSMKAFGGNDIAKCPRCGAKTKHDNIYYDEIMEVEYDIVCTECKYQIYNFSYGSIEFKEQAQDKAMQYWEYDNVSLN